MVSTVLEIMPVDNVGRLADSTAPYSLVYPIDPYPYIVADSSME